MTITSRAPPIGAVSRKPSILGEPKTGKGEEEEGEVEMEEEEERTESRRK